MRHRSWVGLLLFLLLCAVPVLADTPTPAAAPEGLTPEGVCNDFMGAMQARDWQKAWSYFTKTRQQKVPYEGFALMYDNYGPRFVIEHWRVELKDSSEHSAGKIIVTSQFSGQESTSDTAVELVKEDGEWRINSYK